MKRDMNLVREILLWAEMQPHGYLGANPPIVGYSEEEIDYHVFLMAQAGLVDAADTTTMGDNSPNAVLNHLSWSGHEFIDAARDNTIWAKAKSVVLKPAAGIAFDVLLEWLKCEARKKLGI